MQNSIITSTKNDAGLAQNDVIAVNVGADGIQTVSARELHEKLESNERFSKWWERFASYGFEENSDFSVCTKKYAANQHGGEKEFSDYAITIEMAKQICMLQRSERGRLYREYFLRLEKAWNTPEAVMARALQVANKTLEEAKKQIDIQRAQIAEMKPSADSWETYAGDMEHRESEKSFREVAKLLYINPQNRLQKRLFEKAFLMRGRYGWTATQQGLRSGMFVNRIVTGENGHAAEQCKVTAFGMKKLAEMKRNGFFEHCEIAERSYGEKRPPRDYRRRTEK